jgi:hypothetical protein
VSYEQQAVIRTDAVQLLERLARVEPARQRPVLTKALALLRAPRLSRQLGGLACSDLRAEQHPIEFHADPSQRDSGGPGLAFAPLGQPAFGILARAMRLGLGVT